MEARLLDVPDGTLTTPRGFRAGATASGIRDTTPGRLDLTLLVSDERCPAAAVFTRNRFQGAALHVSKRHLADGYAQALIANSGVANAFTGEQGEVETAGRGVADAGGGRPGAKAARGGEGAVGHIEERRFHAQG